MKLILTILLIALCISANAAYYASTTGSGNGSITAPFGLQAALSGTVIKAGDTLYLRGGTYKGLYICGLNGTAEKPIIIRPYQQERVILDGSLAGQTYKNKAALTLNGSYYWLMGIEVTNSDPERTITIAGSNPIERRGGGIDIFGVGVKVINCIIYDVGQGLSWWKTAINGEVYGNVVFNNGWWSTDREHGHGLYSQNETGLKTASNNIIFNNFGYGFHVYGSDAAPLKNYLLTDNVLFNDHNLIGGGQALENITLSGTKVYGDKIELGYGNEPNRQLRLLNNYLPNGALIKYWTDVKIEGNTIFNLNKYTCALTLLFNGTPNYTTFSFAGNNYYWSSPGPGYPAYLPLCWKNAGVTPNQEGIKALTDGSVSNMPMKSSTEFVLSGKKIFVDKNKHDNDKATITIYNWDRSNTIDIVVDSVLSVGDLYVIRNVQSYFTDTIAGTYNGKLSIPMQGRSVAKPLGYASEIAPSTFPEFGVWVLEKRAAVKDTVIVPPVVDTVKKPVVDTVVYVPFKIEWTNVLDLYDEKTQELKPGKHLIVVKKIVNRRSSYDTIPVQIFSDSSSFAIHYYPIADAGKDTSFILGKTGQLSGKATVQGATIAKWYWRKVSGPSRGKISWSSRQTTTLTGNVAGTYVYELTVTSTNGLTATDKINVTFK